MTEVIKDEFCDKSQGQLATELADTRRQLARLQARLQLLETSMEQALQDSEARFHALVEGAVEGILVHRDTKPLFVNPSYARILGYESPNEILAMDSVLPLIAPYDQERLLSYHAARIKGEPAPTQYEYDIVSKDGSIITLHHLVTTILWDGAPAVLSSISDVTKRKKAEAEIQRLYEQTKRDAEIKALLLREVNHRVGNNLTAIISLLQFEQAYTGVDSPMAYQARLRELTNRVQGLATVHRLLSANQWSPLLLSELAHQVIDSALQVLPSERGVTVEVAPVPVLVSPAQANSLALIINELATNSLKYAWQNGHSGCVSVHIDHREDLVLFEYRDDGPGFPTDVLSMERLGTGLDLILLLADSGLRGEVALDNDQGAVVTLRFQVAAEWVENVFANGIRSSTF